MLNAVIIDDERHCGSTIQLLLARHPQRVQVQAVFQDPAKGLAHLQKNSCDLLFLDIEMPGINGFQLLEELGSTPIHIVFTTAYDRFAVKAFKVHAIDYLLKPVQEDELLSAIERVEKLTRSGVPAGPLVEDRLRTLLNELRAPAQEKQRIAFSTVHGLDMVDTSDIICCQSESNYTRIHLMGNQRILVSKTLREVAEQLPAERFMRVHNSFFVNLDHVQKYLRGDGGTLVMNNGLEVKVSRTKKDELLQRLGV